MSQDGQAASSHESKKSSPGVADFLGWLGIDGGVFGAIKAITEDGANFLVYLNWVFAFTLILYVSIWPIVWLVLATENSGISKWFEDLPDSVQIFTIIMLTTAVMMVVAFGWFRVQDTNLAENPFAVQLIGGFCGFAILVGSYLAIRSRRT